MSAIPTSCIVTNKYHAQLIRRPTSQSSNTPIRLETMTLEDVPPGLAAAPTMATNCIPIASPSQSRGFEDPNSDNDRRSVRFPEAVVVFMSAC